MPEQARTLGDLLRLWTAPRAPAAPPVPEEGPNVPWTGPPLSRTQRTLGALLEMGVDAFMGVTGLPGAPDTRARTFGELLSAAVPLAGIRRIAKPIKAYHGSPHDFDEFSMSKIGTGEGAQAYGHGLYFGEASDVGRGYRDMVGARHTGGMHNYDPQLKIGGLDVNDVYRRIDTQAARLPIQQAQGEYDKLEILERLMQDGDVLGVEEAIKAGNFTPAAITWFQKEVAPKFTRKGRLYDVNIHADPEDFLDWDAPLSQQSEKVRQRVLQQLKPNRLERYMSGEGHWQPPPREGMTGAEAYHHIKERLREEGMSGPLAASLDLRGTSKTGGLVKGGIPGIKYLDQGSRAAGQGTRNYVVFDAKLLEIVKKYGIVGAVSAGLISHAQARQLQEQGYQ